MNINKRMNDLTGKQFGKLRVLSLHSIVPSSPGRNRTRWLCECECGIQKDILSSNLLSGSTISCGCSKTDYTKYRLIEEKVTLSYYGSLQSNAKKRGINFDLTIKYLYELYIKQEKKCALSNLEIELPSFSLIKSKCLNLGSIDRIDSSKSYTEGNVQWVHKDINKMKMDLDQEQFLKLCKLVAQYRI